MDQSFAHGHTAVTVGNSWVFTAHQLELRILLEQLQAGGQERHCLGEKAAVKQHLPSFLLEVLTAPGVSTLCSSQG